jgi:hypothetical protein
MITLALLTALGGADWQPLALDTFRAPPAMFFCKGNEADAGLFTVYLRHNQELSVIDVSRTVEGEMVQIKDRLQNVIYREPATGGFEVKIPVVSGPNSAEVVLVLGDGPERATVAWSAGNATYSAACTSAPVPPGRTE